MIRKARLSDAQAIQSLIEFYAKKDLMILRSLNEIYENLRDFWIWEESGAVIGCCALHIFGWDGLAEIKSLAVDAVRHHKGIGTKLVLQCLSEAKELGLTKIFVLTYAPEFFEKLKFARADKAQFPQKIWAECCKCPKFPDCDEIALIYNTGR